MCFTGYKFNILNMKLESSRYKKSFTLIELLVVIAIIGILAGIILTSVNSAREKAKIAKARSTVRQIRTAIAFLEDDANEWPGHKTIEDIESGAIGNEIWDLNVPEAGLVQTDGNFTNWAGPYISAGFIPLDPWGNNYFFDTDYDIDPTAGQKWAVAIGSFGPNGIGQNLYDSDDIIEVIVSQ